MKKNLMILMMLTLMVVLLAACNDEPAPITAGCIAYSSRSNCKPVNFESEAIRNLTEDVAESYGTLGAVCIDGNPDIVGNVGFDDVPEQVKEDGSRRIKEDAKKRVSSFISTVAEYSADDPETDLLAALQLAVRSVRSNKDAERMVIVAADSGLDTCGEANFRKNLLSADPDRIAEDLYRREAIPDFSGITVVFQNLGDVESPQGELTLKQVNRLKEIWRAIVEKTGGEVCFDDALPADRSTEEKFPDVTVIDLPREVAIDYTGNGEIDLADALIISEERVKFIGDSDKYADSSAAESILKPIAAYLAANEKIRILLIGTTAGDENSEYNVKLSKQRAEAVRSTLVGMGVDARRIAVLGMGNSDPWHIPGVGTEGDMAAQNRKVVLLDAESETAKAIVN